ncbi:MAG: Electron transport complex, RnfABCDGE type, G subunit [Caldanaerobacter subterraneus]|jgi:electron transport complex protein RnfG|uniref:Ion-translocating oxidoreductase complex subunit G n=1 Tax=Caldanaerobacter subterraneus TaxID=911092 RepID=A0A101E5N4_9THEO|nr:RnfABCDGE type electron transport complex subunit G [Caldanaerobacter subterraneus]KUK09031.1 MAG: Electron transport complex, RnfABCDGE type, G subunit [Caldanaerobacter subterraneus]TCO68575.1 electron transport complex protein RnfG [Caldanaerobacter subterraneus]HBT49254.1 electron transporter RnfG [Caldanaerobacter subterraneus]
MKETVKVGLILFLITAVAGVILGVSNAVTSEKIAEMEEIANNTAKQEVLKEAKSFVTLDEKRLKEIAGSNQNVLEISEGYDANSSLVGYVFKITSNGYGGEIQFMVGISKKGYITGIKILNHKETPGLGANATKSFFTDSFKGKSVADKLVVVKHPPKADNEIQALTGATITSNAIVNGVNMVREIYNSKLAN